MLYFFTTLAIGHFPSLDSYCEFFQIFNIHSWLEEINAMARASCVPTRFSEMADLTRREIADCRAMLSSWQGRETTTAILFTTACDYNVGACRCKSHRRGAADARKGSGDQNNLFRHNNSLSSSGP